ncbi:hypothetical protein NDU88_006656 [Pleurodeles waltl]|uniref:Uncharacterized protein n=1 Tax=Pleurodeles waltl TaxID=8319 RepID=A0AAV7PJ02_PLEWA|nr:hypothetical protein NDU88_006656 [Pleurodeles waltl]
MLAHRLRSKVHSGAVKMICTGSSTSMKMDAKAVKAFRSFYGKLCASTDDPKDDPQRYLERIELTPLPQSEALALERLIWWKKSSRQ